MLPKDIAETMSEADYALTMLRDDLDVARSVDNTREWDGLLRKVEDLLADFDRYRFGDF
jgi:hypothetical protein